MVHVLSVAARAVRRKRALERGYISENISKTGGPLDPFDCELIKEEYDLQESLLPPPPPPPLGGGLSYEGLSRDVELENKIRSLENLVFQQSSTIALLMSQLTAYSSAGNMPMKVCAGNDCTQLEKETMNTQEATNSLIDEKLKVLSECTNDKITGLSKLLTESCVQMVSSSKLELTDYFGTKIEQVVRDYDGIIQRQLESMERQVKALYNSHLAAESHVENLNDPCHCPTNETVECNAKVSRNPGLIPSTETLEDNIKDPDDHFSFATSDDTNAPAARGDPTASTSFADSVETESLHYSFWSNCPYSRTK